MSTLGIDFHLVGAGIVVGSDTDCLAIGIYKKNESNYSYIAEVDINFKVLRFRELSCRGLLIHPCYAPQPLRVGGQCPVLLVGRQGSVDIVDTPIEDIDVDRLINNETSALLASQLVKIAKVPLSRAIVEFGKLAKHLQLGKPEGQEFISSMVHGFQQKGAIWKSIAEDHVRRVDWEDRYKSWSNDKISGWLSSHYEIDDSSWYKIWTYFDEFRRMDDDVLSYGLMYLQNWKSEIDYVLPVGMVISRLLASGIGEKNRSSIVDVIESGFLTGKFFNRSSHVSSQRRSDWFCLLKDDYLDRKAKGEYDEFLHNFLVSGLQVVNSGKSRKSELFVTSDEMSLYFRDITSSISSRGYIYRESVSAISAAYFASRNWGNPDLRKRLADLVRSSGRQTEDVMRAYSSGLAEKRWH